METGYRFIDHTADAGVEGAGRSPEEAFENVLRGLLAILTDPASVRPVEERSLAVGGVDREDLLVRWLSEILFLVQGRAWIPAEAQITRLDAERLASTLRGEPFDPARHAIRAEVKAATYHGLHVGREGGHWVARVIFDL